MGVMIALKIANATVRTATMIRAMTLPGSLGLPEVGWTKKSGVLGAAWPGMVQGSWGGGVAPQGSAGGAGGAAGAGPIGAGGGAIGGVGDTGGVGPG